MSPIQFDFTQGRLEETNRRLDVAISGDGFFTVEGSQGPLYTRNGSFHAGPDGTLTTIDNLPVLSGGRPIELPQGATTENIDITRDGRMSANGQEFAQLDLVQFSDPSLLTAEGASLFAAPPEKDMEWKRFHYQYLRGMVLKENQVGSLPLHSLLSISSLAPSFGLGVVSRFVHHLAVFRRFVGRRR